MAETITETGTLYSPTVGLIYIFNLIVGTGALTMPKAFDSAGWLLSIILVTVLAFMSYLTATFVIEAMAASNALLRWKRHQRRNRVGSVNNEDDNNDDVDNDDDVRIEQPRGEDRPLLAPVRVEEIHRALFANDSHLFDITERVEMAGAQISPKLMGQMASLFFNRIGVNLFYLCIGLYLYGDLAIYAAAVPKSMRDVACTWVNKADNHSCNSSLDLQESDPCWPSAHSITRLNAYRVFLAFFTLSLGPFIFFNVQKTKYLQIFTTIMRWLAFGMMIILAVIRLAEGKGEGQPEVVNFNGIPTLFGVCVYSFMCHHSLPSLATPIKNKSKIFTLFAGDYSLILVFYAVLSFTGIFSFRTIQDLYTLNFKASSCPGEEPITNVLFIQYFLALFPVFTLSTNFPIIGITLRNNIKTLFYREGRPYSWPVDRLVFPLATIIPPIIVAFITHDVEVLVGVTGSYAGAGIQYLVPIGLVWFARRRLVSIFGDEIKNKHGSPFSHMLWLWFVLAWAVVAIIFVTVNHIVTKQ